MKSVVRRRASAWLRPILWVVLVLCALLVALYGPALFDLYRLDRTIQQQSAERGAVAGPWPSLPDVCMPCHGRLGRTLNDFYPQLAGQPVDYLVAQLHAFADGTRVNPNMGPLARELSATEITQLARFFAAQQPPAGDPARADAEQATAARVLTARLGCAGCHGADYAGQGAVPRLAGQGYSYLVRQLRDFRSGQRTDPAGAMNALTRGLTDSEIEGLAAYLASYGTKTE